MLNAYITFGSNPKKFHYRNLREAYSVGKGTMLVTKDGKRISSRNSKIVKTWLS